MVSIAGAGVVSLAGVITISGSGDGVRSIARAELVSIAGAGVLSGAGAGGVLGAGPKVISGTEAVLLSGAGAGTTGRAGAAPYQDIIGPPAPCPPAQVVSPC